MLKLPRILLFISSRDDPQSIQLYLSPRILRPGSEGGCTKFIQVSKNFELDKNILVSEYKIADYLFILDNFSKINIFFVKIREQTVKSNEE